MTRREFTALLGHDPLPTPDDYEVFWAEALEEARRHPLDLRAEAVDSGLATIDVLDLSFAGADGRRVRGWLRLPRHRTGPLPAVLHANGYGAGRLSPIDDLTWSAAGWAHLVVDTHGQGGGSTGHLLDGIDDPRRSYYRGVFVDAARAVDALRSLDAVDPARVAAIGNSQGGGIALGVGALVPDLVAVLAQAPFLTDAPDGLRFAQNGPWLELRAYLTEHPDRAARVAATLAYVDGVTSARHAVAPGWISDGLEDDICPPETARAAAQEYAAPVVFREWPGAGHEAGATADRQGAIAVLRERFGAGADASAGSGTGEARA
ncbi:acetylxylan esterase [Leifsonia sp. F6_8S_P_1B]|uniref:Acetylxylan esterase n=1 Tax=Leifsonia williamsii TaxID=3035919 RepID=A0ABT8K990_9MICO|nr:acetylxylan esterase [Leifsonia williamsii]MDN4614040.1 acetylxylan esterase [Leifsonia williamsii]